MASRAAVLVILSLLLAACISPAAAPAAQFPLAGAGTPTHSATPLTGITLPTGSGTLQTGRGAPSATATQPMQPSASAPLPSATPQPPFAVCSPLEGIALAELGRPDLLKNPFEQPRAGMDDGHHGADFAYWSRGERSSMLGHPVLAVLSGQVAAVLENRQPYGYAVIIETPLDALPADWLASREIPAPQPTVPAAPNLSCPPDPIAYREQTRRSLYLLYAHLDQPPALAAGQTVTCGDPLGVVGTTGRSVNYHLHLETRVGPAGATFPAMAHYDASASQAEMSTYCTWRVSGLFALFDPMLVLR